jgi:hypothetical protein
LRLHDEYRCYLNRFSILTLKILDAVHATFTAEELFGVELVLLNPEALTRKAIAGRARTARLKMHPATGGARDTDVDAEQTTIACVSGFLVNMVNGTIQLVTPTRASDRWPLGYRIYGERKFQTAREFRSGIEELIAAHMAPEVSGSDVLRLCEGVRYRPEPEGGFELSRHNGRLTVRGFSGAALLGDMLHEGNHTAGDIQTALMREGADILVTASAIQGLFDRGFLNDDPRPAQVWRVT